jgi:hypothetical protein
MIGRVVAAVIVLGLAGFGFRNQLDARRIEADFDAMSADLLGLHLDLTSPGRREGKLRPFYFKAEGLYLELLVSPPFADAPEARKALDGLSLLIGAKGERSDPDRGARDETKVLGVANIVGDDDSWGWRQKEGTLPLMQLGDGEYQVSVEVLRPAPAAAARSIRLAGRHLL